MRFSALCLCLAMMVSVGPVQADGYLWLAGEPGAPLEIHRFNQPPHLPSGDQDADTCVVTGMMP